MTYSVLKNLIFVLFFLISISLLAQKESTILFDGTDLNHWTLGPEGGFEIVGKELYTGTFKKGDNLFTKKDYANFIFKLQYNLSTVGNSGVLIRCDEEDPWGTGVEVQLLAPWTPRRDDLHCTGSLYGYATVLNRPDETPNIWHDLEIRCDRNLITVLVDGAITTKANIDTIPKMKEKLYKGVIGLQVNHAEVEGQYTKFRNISIENLDLNMEYVVKGLFEENQKLRKLAEENMISFGTDAIGPLAEILSGNKEVAKNSAKQLLFDLAVTATDPKLEDQEFSKKMEIELTKAIKDSNKNYAKNYMKGILKMVVYDGN
ncbi:MAG: DUF1080 domain-containing protein [Allomuricauda sp.]